MPALSTPSACALCGRFVLDATEIATASPGKPVCAPCVDEYARLLELQKASGAGQPAGAYSASLAPGQLGARSDVGAMDLAPGTFRVGRVTLSDRASAGAYSDSSGPEIERVVAQLFAEPLHFVRALLPDDLYAIARELCRLTDDVKCPLVVTTGGTGPAPRDVTPEATRLVITRELPGFGEAMRAASFASVKTAILSRATAGIRGRSLIINLPGRPRAIGECLSILGPAIAEALDHIAGFRPRLAK